MAEFYIKRLGEITRVILTSSPGELKDDKTVSTQSSPESKSSPEASTKDETFVAPSEDSNLDEKKKRSLSLLGVDISPILPKRVKKAALVQDGDSLHDTRREERPRQHQTSTPPKPNHTADSEIMTEVQGDRSESMADKKVVDRPIRDKLRTRKTPPRSQNVSAKDKEIVADGQDRSTRDKHVRKQKSTRRTTTSHAGKPTLVKENATSTRDSVCSQNARGAREKIPQSRFQDDFDGEAKATNAASVPKHHSRARTECQKASSSSEVGSTAAPGQRTQQQLSLEMDALHVMYNADVVKRICAIKSASGPVQRGLECCHDVMKSWYVDVKKAVLDFKKRQREGSNHSAEIGPLRNGLAELWCFYAEAVGNITGSENQPRRRGRPKSRSAYAERTAPDVHGVPIDKCETLLPTPAERLKLTTEVLDLARSCPIIGSHHLIVQARLKIVFGDNPSLLHSSLQDFQAANAGTQDEDEADEMRQLLSTGIGICNDAIRKSSNWRDCVSSTFADREMMRFLDESSIYHYIAESISALRSIVGHLNRLCPPSYHVLDRPSTSIVCHQVNRLSRLKAFLHKDESKSEARGICAPDRACATTDKDRINDQVDDPELGVTGATETRDKDAPQEECDSESTPALFSSDTKERYIEGSVHPLQDKNNNGKTAESVTPENPVEARVSIDPAAAPKARKAIGSNCFCITYACMYCFKNFKSEDEWHNHQNGCRYPIQYTPATNRLREIQEHGKYGLKPFYASWPGSLDPEDGKGFTTEECVDLLDYTIKVFTVTKDDAKAMESMPSFGGVIDYPPLAGQVGLRCCFCRERNSLGLPIGGSFVFPASCETITDSIRNLCENHLDSCPNMPRNVKQRYQQFRETVSFSSTTQESYWADVAAWLQTMEDTDGICWRPT